MIVGLGVELVETERFESALDQSMRKSLYA